MAKMEIAIDLGTSFTSIFVSGNGIVLHEPSVVAFYDYGVKRGVRAAGEEAYQMIGKAPEKTKVVCPINDGVIKDADACAVMLGEFIKRILPASYIIKPRIHAIVGVPTGITVAERKMYEEVLMTAGVDEIELVNSVMLAAIGVELPISSNYGGFIVSIGGGVTELAILSLCGIVTGCSINIGGDMIDRTIVDSIQGIYHIKTDRITARRVKEKICSLVRNDRSKASISGIDVETKNIATYDVTADELYGAVYAYYDNIIESIADVINSSSPAVAAEIKKNGVTLVGGGADIPGLAKVAKSRLKISVNIPRDPQYATVAGGGMLISDKELLDDILLHA